MSRYLIYMRLFESRYTYFYLKKENTIFEISTFQLATFYLSTECSIYDCSTHCHLLRCCNSQNRRSKQSHILSPKPSNCSIYSPHLFCSLSCPCMFLVNEKCMISGTKSGINISKQISLLHTYKVFESYHYTSGINIL